jgi:hypothetical protein
MGQDIGSGRTTQQLSAAAVECQTHKAKEQPKARSAQQQGWVSLLGCQTQSQHAQAQEPGAPLRPHTRIAGALQIESGLLPCRKATLQVLDAAMEAALVKGLRHRFGLTSAGTDQNQVMVGMLTTEQAAGRDVVAPGNPGPNELALPPNINHQRSMVIRRAHQLEVQVAGGKGEVAHQH